MKTRYKRIFAFLIDWGLALLPIVPFSLILSTPGIQDSVPSIVTVLLSLLIFPLPLALFIARDGLFQGRSPGKRLFGLCVYDKTTLQGPTIRQFLLRNVFLLIYPIDALILLTTGDSLGDRVANTVVLSSDAREHRLSECTASDMTVPVSGKGSAAEVVKVTALALAVLVAFVGLIQSVLSAQKDTEEYQIAYNYLISSQAFQALHVEESELRINSYSSSSSYSPDREGYTQTVEFGFLVNFRSFHVVLHKENDLWSVCRNCTPFQ